MIKKENAGIEKKEESRMKYCAYQRSRTKKVVYEGERLIREKEGENPSPFGRILAKIARWLFGGFNLHELK